MVDVDDVKVLTAISLKEILLKNELYETQIETAEVYIQCRFAKIKSLNNEHIAYNVLSVLEFHQYALDKYFKKFHYTSSLFLVIDEIGIREHLIHAQ